jgi:hypothetical protein
VATGGCGEKNRIIERFFQALAIAQPEIGSNLLAMTVFRPQCIKHSGWNIVTPLSLESEGQTERVQTTSANAAQLNPF